MFELLTISNLKVGLPWIVGLALLLWAILFVVNIVRLIVRYRRPSAAPSVTARDLIKHENDLMNHRLTWLLTAEGLLFTALGFGLSKENPQLASQLIPVLSFVGVVLAASASIVLDAADAAIIRLSPPVTEHSRDDVIGYRGIPGMGLLSPWRIYPAMFTIAWHLISQIK